MTTYSPDPATTSSPVAERIEAARRKIARACRIAARDSAGVTLTAVTKTQTEAVIRGALDAGQRVFGENRVQEGQAHWAGLRGEIADLELRLIGPLQTNKAADAVALFDVIETVDRPKLAEALAAEARKQGRALRVLVQVNTGEEPQKAGVLPSDADALIGMTRALGLKVEGLMCIPPVDEAPGLHFALLRKIARRNRLSVLSMGMSDDFDVAIRFGATHVRLGSALFGERKPA
jgi:pyridoxal phosphate enzyme (YggS family)